MERGNFPKRGESKLRKWTLFLMPFVVLLTSSPPFFLPGLPAVAAEKVRFGSALKTHPVFLLPSVAAEEKGLWKQQGVSVEWIPLDGTGPMMRGTAARHIDMGMSGVVDQIPAAAAGIPVIIVAHMGVKTDFYIWVRSDSPIREPQDLRRTKIGINLFGGSAHAYLQAMVKALRIEKEVKTIALGGLPHMVAGLKARTVDAIMITFFFMAPLKVKGEVREILAVVDYLPQPWLDRSIYSHRAFVNAQPEEVRKAIKGMLDAGKFIMGNRDWAIRNMVTHSRFTKEAAELVYPLLKYSQDGLIDPAGVKNVRQFLIDYGIVSSDKVPPVEELYTNKFVG